MIVRQTDSRWVTPSRALAPKAEGCGRGLIAPFVQWRRGSGHWVPELAFSVRYVERREDFNATGLSAIPRQKGTCFLVSPVTALPGVTLQQWQGFSTHKSG